MAPRPTPLRIQVVYYTLTLFSTLASSLIWGINTLFLLDAGLTNLQAFAANAFFTAGMVLFEVPTGVVADTRGRRVSYLIGTVTLAVATLLYLLAWQAHAGMWAWAATSLLLGLGFTFFSGATEAWLVDALAFAGHRGPLDPVLARGQVVQGAGMLAGSVAGGLVAQATHLGVPYLLRVAALILTALVVVFVMRDWGFTPAGRGAPLREVRRVLRTSIDHGIRRAPVRWMMLASPFTMGVAVYAFYAMQPYLLELHGDPRAYGVAGLAAAIVGGAQMAGGLVVPLVRRVFARRTSLVLATTLLAAASLLAVGLTQDLWLTVALLVAWAVAFAAERPVRQAYLNGLIPSEARATVLSFDNLMGSSGGVVAQPALGRVADAAGYAASYVVCAGLQLAALPFVLLARRARAVSDATETGPDERVPPGGP